MGGQVHLWGCSDLAMGGSGSPVRMFKSTYGGSGLLVGVFRSTYRGGDQIYLRGELDSLVRVAR